MRPVFGLLLMIVSISVSAVEAKPQNDSTKVQSLIERLGADDYSEREKATDEIRRLDQKALASLRTAVKTAKDPEIQKRLYELILYCEPGGEGNDRVNIYAECDKKSLNIGDTVTFTIALRNKSDRTQEFKFESMIPVPVFSGFCLATETYMAGDPKRAMWVNAHCRPNGANSSYTISMKPRTIDIHVIRAVLKKGANPNTAILQFEDECNGFHEFSEINDAKLMVMIVDPGKRLGYHSNVMTLKLNYTEAPTRK